LVIETLIGLAEQFPRYGSGKLFPLVRRQQPSWNHKRVYREYCALKLNLRRKGKKRLPSRHPEKLAVPVAANVCWSVDFMSDVLMSGQRFRTFNVLDDFNREALAILGANPWGDTGVHPAGQAPPRTRLSSVLTAPSAKKCWISMFSTD
jgi:putative transposase